MKSLASEFTDRKYELIQDQSIYAPDSTKLYRIRALRDFDGVKAGEIGGSARSFSGNQAMSLFRQNCLLIILSFCIVTMSASAQAACSGGYYVDPRNDAVCQGAPTGPDTNPSPPPAGGGSTPTFPYFCTDPADTECPGGPFAEWTEDGITCTTYSAYWAEPSYGRFPTGKCNDSFYPSQWLGRNRGNAVYVCQKGEWKYIAGTCKEATGCNSRLSASWSGNDSSSCSAQITDSTAEVANGTTITKSNTKDGASGKITFKCDEGEWRRDTSSTATYCNRN